MISEGYASPRVHNCRLRQLFPQKHPILLLPWRQTHLDLVSRLDHPRGLGKILRKMLSPQPILLDSKTYVLSYFDSVGHSMTQSIAISCQPVSGPKESNHSRTRHGTHPHEACYEHCNSKWFLRTTEEQVPETKCRLPAMMTSVVFND